jgi:dTDP-4-dehydrorhamnose reductase
MKFLITGSTGQLGQELVRQSRGLNVEIQTPSRMEMDITDIDQIHHHLVNYRPSIVVNAAAYTHVDKAETECDLAFAVNKAGPAFLAQSCAKLHIPLIHISTDYVFDGTKEEPYVETDPIAPLGMYGRSKAEGETAIRSCLKEHIIIRTSWLYSVYRHNFVKTMLKLGAEKNVIRVVSDQFGSPTSAADLAEAVLTISAKIHEGIIIDWGIYHYCSAGITTWHGFAENILDLAKPYGSIKVQRVEAISTAEFPTPAKRPVYSVLNCKRIKKHFGIEPKAWQASLQTTIDRIYSGD